MITVAQQPDALRRVVDAYRSAGGRGPLRLLVHVSYAKTDAEALAIANDQWRSGLVGPPLAWDLDTPDAFEAAVHDAPDDAIRDAVLVDADPSRLADRVRGLVELGFDEVYLHHVGKAQEEFLEVAGGVLVPALR
jgi:hypothetical protein